MSACRDCDSPYHRRCPSPPRSYTTTPAQAPDDLGRSVPAVVRIAVGDDHVTCAACRALRPLEAPTCPRCRLSPLQASMLKGLANLATVHTRLRAAGRRL